MTPNTPNTLWQLFLFVGGNHDGKRLEVASKIKMVTLTAQTAQERHTSTTPPAQERHSIPIERYTRRTISFPEGRTLELFALDTLTDYQVQQALLEGYKR